MLVSTAEHVQGCIYVIRDARIDAGPQAGWDTLTGLPDRQSLEIHLEQMLNRTSGKAWQLLYLDLDQFKVVNDLCGHRAGDELLQRLTSTWQVLLRDDEYLARLGGDEFCAVLSRSSLKSAAKVAELLIDAAQRMRFEWKRQIFRIGASGGLVDRNAGDSADALLAAADSACWVAKENGRNRLHVLDSRDREVHSRHEQMGWVSRIGHAIDESRMVLHYQRIEPIAGERNGGHAEILVRMLDEDGRLVPPGRFIPAAERYNLMPRLDRWVIERVFAGLADQMALKPDVPLGRWSINLSGTTFSDPRFTEWVQSQIANYGIPSDSIGFELTETAAISNLERAREFIAAMRKLGCSISLDDFGSGVSSFAYLRSLDIDYLKIDGTFVRNVRKDRIDYAMVEAIHRVGSVMGIPTIAEFVEDAAIVDKLHDIGVHFGQGYGLHRPQFWSWGPQLGVDLVLA